jgi:polyketide biosynthesis enoyl-CoA hydratase PksH
MPYKTITFNKYKTYCEINLNRPNKKNSINQLMLEEINIILDEVESSDDWRVLFFKGKEGYFCTGMDLEEVYEKINTPEEDFSESFLTSLFMKTLKRLSSINKIVISMVQGQVNAGGVGILAVSDLVFATTNSQFALSEALWGLLPGCVVPFLIRRVGYQQAYRLTLTTLSIDAEKAKNINLVDELTDSSEEIIRTYMIRFNRIDSETIREIKSYFRKMWIISDNEEKTAISEMSRLINSSKVKSNIINYFKKDVFPWENHKVNHRKSSHFKIKKVC